VGSESSHNLKYWTRQPYLGFGVDAHSMLPSLDAMRAVRFSTPESLEEFVAAGASHVTEVSPQASLEEAFFLGLRLNRGIDLDELSSEFGEGSVSTYSAVISEFTGMGLLERAGSVIRLTPPGRLLSNEVFEQFISVPDQVA